MLGGLFLGLSSLAFAQEATVVGTITDPSGSAIPDAKLLPPVWRLLLRVILTPSPDSTCCLIFSIGHYDIKVEAAGFKIAEQKNVVLQVGDRTRFDFQMQIGGAAETVTVEANAVRVQTDSGEAEQRDHRTADVADRRQRSKHLSARGFDSRCIQPDGATA